MLRSAPTTEDALAVLGSPRPVNDLAVALGLDPESDDTWTILEEVLDDPRLVGLGDLRVASAAGLLDGLVLWHRVDAVEVASRCVSLGLDGLLAVHVVPEVEVVRVGDHEVPLTMWTGPGDPDIDRGATVPLPDGWAPDLAADELVAVTLDGGRLRLHRADDVDLGSGPPAGDGEVAALGDAITSVARREAWPLSFLADRRRDVADQWLLDMAEVGPALLADHGPVLRALRRLPLGEALAEAGLRFAAAIVAGPGVDAQQLETFMVGRIVAGDAIAPGSVELVEACGIALGVLCGPITADHDEVATTRALRIMVDDPTVAERLGVHLGAVHRSVLAEAERRLRPVRAAHRDDPGAAWLHASLLLAQGRAHDARDALEAMVAALTDDARVDMWSSAVDHAARVRAVAGDLTGATTLYRQVGNDGVADQLAAWMPRRPSVGRNERCPCGSGRKAKHCCLRAPRPPLIGERIGLVWWKVSTWSLAARIDEVGVAARLAHTLDGDEDRHVGAVVSLLLDAHMIEGDGIGDSLDQIGALLPADEQDIAGRWRRCRHAAWTVVSAHGAEPPIWRHHQTGEQATIVGALPVGRPADDHPAGTHVLAALVPGPEGHHVAGRALPVSRADVDVVQSLVDLGLDAASFTALGLALLDAARVDGDPTAVAGFVRRREAAWCDEPHPALGGLTPRDAASDPGRYEDVVALVDALAPEGTTALPGRAFDPDRLRDALGLGAGVKRC